MLGPGQDDPKLPETAKDGFAKIAFWGARNARSRPRSSETAKPRKKDVAEKNYGAQNAWPRPRVPESAKLENGLGPEMLSQAQSRETTKEGNGKQT